jgi:hypothetical protein
MDLQSAALFILDTQPQSRFSLFSILLLVLSGANLYGVVLALLRPESRSKPVPDPWGTASMLMLTCSQVLYLIFVSAWLFKWVHFYPGNPVQMTAIYVGLLLSAAALLTAIAGSGLKRLMGIVVALTSALLWLITLIGSVTI